MESETFNTFTFYPNPVKNQLTLKAGSTIEKVLIYNLIGQNILEEQGNSFEIQLNTNNLKHGLYLMEVTINGCEKNFRLVKE